MIAVELRIKFGIVIVAGLIFQASLLEVYVSVPTYRCQMEWTYRCQME